jgi:hypothetical protein
MRCLRDRFDFGFLDRLRVPPDVLSLSSNISTAHKKKKKTKSSIKIIKRCVKQIKN